MNEPFLLGRATTQTQRSVQSLRAMTTSIPIAPVTATQLLPTETSGICTVQVGHQRPEEVLTWDRYCRLNAAAHAISQNFPTGTRILDVGGFDGALALFLPGYDVDLLDPATTHGSLLSSPVKDRAYTVIAAIDVLEHIDPKDRGIAIKELARMSCDHVILNYPCPESLEAQELVLALTGNQLIAEHVHWPLPDTNWVIQELRKHGLQATWQAHTSQAIWLGQYLTLNLAPQAAPALNKHLIANAASEACSQPLYHLVTARRSQV